MIDFPDFVWPVTTQCGSLSPPTVRGVSAFSGGAALASLKAPPAARAPMTPARLIKVLRVLIDSFLSPVLYADFRQERLTRKSSATAGGSELSQHPQGSHKSKLFNTPASGWLERLVRCRVSPQLSSQP